MVFATAASKLSSRKFLIPAGVTRGSISNAIALPP
jgi:hypothetical protein